MHRNYLFLSKFKTNARVIYSVRCLNTKSNLKDKENYDVIIAGGGMVGCTLACAMGKYPLLSKLRVLLLEGSPKKDFVLKPDYSNRVVALNQNTKSLMNTLNVWNHVEDMRVQPVRHMQVWDACSDAMITFSSSDILDDDVAYIVENDVLLHAINMELKQCKNVDTVYQAKISGYELCNEEKDVNKVIMSNGDTYSCQLLMLKKVMLEDLSNYNTIYKDL